ncbi:MAG: methionyl-tRNA formyltransferase [Pseudonocardiales bacterium]|nr:methionyl-tRNA formyltransferase [Pseudonocardiales bacterium]
MRLIFAGTPAVATVSLQALLDSPRHEVVAVLTRPEKPAGRGRRPSAAPVADLARAHGIEVLAPPTLRDPLAQAALRAFEPDCCPVVAYGGLIPRDALDIPVHGWVNLHFSLLPAWRGAAPVQRSVLAGDDVTGATTFLIEEGLDTGPVFGVLTESVRPSDTSGDLLQRLAVAGSQLLLATLDGLEDGMLVPEPQPSDGISLAPKISVDDARIDWSAPALRVDRLIRACTPEPGAWTTLGDTRIKVGPVRLAPADPDRTGLAPGQVLIGRSQVLVGTASQPVVLGEVQPPGKRPMPATDWARGARLTESDRFA